MKSQKTRKVSSSKRTGETAKKKKNQIIEADLVRDGRKRKHLSAQKKREILRARSKELAGEVFDEQYEDGYLEVVEFSLAFENYAVESSYVSEVYPLRDFTLVPCTPRFVLGITNIRGKIISVVDIKKFFNLPEKGLTNLNRVIVVQTSNMELGILADSILGVRLLPMSSIQPTLPTLTDIRSEYLQGVTEDRIVILDVKKIISDPRIIVREEVDQ